MFLFTHQYISEHSDWMYIVLQLLNFFEKNFEKTIDYILSLPPPAIAIKLVL